MDELVLTRTLKEELMSVFSEEAQIMADLDACEKELEEAGADMDKMQVPKPSPQTLNLETLYPIPYTLIPKPEIPIPYTLNSNPQSRV